MQSLDFEKKVLLVGDGAVGKTSLVRRFVIDKFDDKYIITIGTKTSRKPMEFTFAPEQLKINLMLDIWDILGQKEGMDRAHRLYFRGAESALVVFDVTNRDSFEHVDAWVTSLRSVVGGIPGVLACNKVDLTSDYKVTDEEAAAKAAQHGLAYVRTSAKTGDNVEPAFRFIGESLCKPLVAKYAGGGPLAGGQKKKGLFGRGA